jgi:hypothetical protein
MSLPLLTAEASLYRSSIHYLGGHSVTEESFSREFVPAYAPTIEVTRQCETADNSCGKDFVNCMKDTLGLGSPICLGFYWECLGENRVPGLGNTLSPCCPTLCDAGQFAKELYDDPSLTIAIGCCDDGEHCVDPNDPPSRYGCCPADQAVCGGKCCWPGETCCGDTCCDTSSSSVCIQDVCCPAGTPGLCNGQCCDGPCDGHGNCCPPPSHLCGSECCAGFSPCCNGVCCELGSLCVAGSCCPSNQVCGNTCCPSGSKCEDPTTGACSACPPGTQPVHCGSPDETLCCPPGTSVCCGGKCCASGEMCCGDPLSCQPQYVCLH